MNSPKAQSEAMAKSIMDSLPYEDCIALAMTSAECLGASRKLNALTVTALEKLLAENERLKARESAMVQADPRQLWNLATFELKEQLTATEARLETMKDGARKYIPKLHLAGCGVFDTDVVKCTCGLDAFLSTLAAEKKEQG